MHSSDVQQFNLTGKVALITGASSGLGAHFAKVLCRNGAKVIAAARRLDRLEALADTCSGLPGSIHPVSMDVTDEGSVFVGFEQAEAACGTVEILVNNAGISDRKNLMQIDIDSWDQVNNTNLRAAWLVAQEATRRMLDANKPGSVINIASVYGVGVGIGNAAYATSKAGLIQMSRSMALELSRKGIRINALSPGYFRTELDDGFFDSDAGSFISGANLVVDGGHLVKSI